MPEPSVIQFASCRTKLYNFCDVGYVPMATVCCWLKTQFIHQTNEMFVYQSVAVIRLSKWYHIKAETLVLSKQSFYANYLICISMNINENVKNDGNSLIYEIFKLWKEKRTDCYEYWLFMKDVYKKTSVFQCASFSAKLYNTDGVDYVTMATMCCPLTTNK